MKTAVACQILSKQTSCLQKSQMMPLLLLRCWAPCPLLCHRAQHPLLHLQAPRPLLRHRAQICKGFGGETGGLASSKGTLTLF